MRMVRLAALALAGATVAGSALAQSSVTIAGRLDMGLQYFDAGVR